MITGRGNSYGIGLLKSQEIHFWIAKIHVSFLLGQYVPLVALLILQVVLGQDVKKHHITY